MALIGQAAIVRLLKEMSEYALPVRFWATSMGC